MKWRKISQNLNMIWGFVSAPEFTNPIRYELLNFAYNYIWKTVRWPHTNFNKFTPSFCYEILEKALLNQVNLPKILIITW